MSNFKSIKPEDLNKNVFEAIGSEWMLVAAQSRGKANAMTASWGGMGVMWGKNVVFVVLRPQRYTKEFVDAADSFSLSFIGKDKERLNYMGTVSGRDEDKIKNSELTLAHSGGAPYFEEANTVLICKKLFAQPYSETSFINADILPRWYPQKDLHTLYIAEITNVLVK